MRAGWGVAALGLALAVAGCGQTTSERTSGGAAAGAAAGAGVGALGGPVGALAGAAVGAGAGALTGASTSPQDVNLGRPPWTNPEARVPGTDDTPRAGRRATRASGDARAAQQALAQAGYDPGPADGVWGAQSVRAAREYQRANNLVATGRLDSATMAALRGGSRPAAGSPATGSPGTGSPGTGSTGSTAPGSTGTGSTGAGTTGPGTGSTGTGSTGTTAPGSPGGTAPATR
jgi:hypothetical protein